MPGPSKAIDYQSFFYNATKHKWVIKDSAYYALYLNATYFLSSSLEKASKQKNQNKTKQTKKTQHPEPSAQLLWSNISQSWVWLVPGCYFAVFCN